MCIRDRPSVEAYNKIIKKERPKLQAIYQEYFKVQQVDALLFPTIKVTAQPIEGFIQQISLNGTLVPTFTTIVHNTNSGSLAGLPGITLPVGLSEMGLPIGMSIDGPVNSVKRLLKIALTLEAIFGKLPPPKENPLIKIFLLSNGKKITSPFRRLLLLPASHSQAVHKLAFVHSKKSFRSSAMQGFFRKNWKQNNLVEIDEFILSSLLT